MSQPPMSEPIFSPTPEVQAVSTRKNQAVQSPMSSSQIRLIDYATGAAFSAAPERTVLYSSANVGWQGITVELHRIPSLELPEHYLNSTLSIR